VALNGSVLQLFETGTVSVCPDKIIGFMPLVFFALRVAKRFTLFFSSSNVLKEVAPNLCKCSSQ
jgi:hypothetical protein